MNKKKTERIVSLNGELLSCDSGEVDLEELERRLEMLVLRDVPCCLCHAFSCPTFSGCGGCGQFSCPTLGSAFSF